MNISMPLSKTIYPTLLEDAILKFKKDVENKLALVFAIEGDKRNRVGKVDDIKEQKDYYDLTMVIDNSDKGKLIKNKVNHGQGLECNAFIKEYHNFIKIECIEIILTYKGLIVDSLSTSKILDSFKEPFRLRLRSVAPN